jgi:hypothetical protein
MNWRPWPTGKNREGIAPTDRFSGLMFTRSRNNEAEQERQDGAHHCGDDNHRRAFCLVVGSEITKKMKSPVHGRAHRDMVDPDFFRTVQTSSRRPLLDFVVTSKRTRIVFRVLCRNLTEPAILAGLALRPTRVPSP